MKNRGKRGKNRIRGRAAYSTDVHSCDFLLSSHPRTTFISMCCTSPELIITDTGLFLGNSLFIMYLRSTLYPSTIPPKSINQNKSNTTAHRRNRNIVLDCKTGRKLIKIPLRAVGEKYQFPFIEISSLDVAQRSVRSDSTTEIPI